MHSLHKNIWEDGENLIITSNQNSVIQKNINDFCLNSNLSNKIIIPTSGSTDVPKWVILSKEAILNSAESVNSHLDINSNDKWLCCLPTNHVSGLSIFARSYVNSSNVCILEGKWNAKSFTESINYNKITFSSLVPTQLHDIVESGRTPNPDLRGLIIGGDHLDHGLHEKSLDLGWPILRTYGMTETCSQVATEPNQGEGLKLLNIWNIKINTNGEILLKGDSLFDGYININSNQHIQLISPSGIGGWFNTGDYGNLRDNKLKIIGRGDQQIKIFGEKVNLKYLKSKIATLYGDAYTVVAYPDYRKGCKLLMVSDDNVNSTNTFNDYNSKAPPIEKVDELRIIKQIPRTELGKINESKLHLILEKMIEA